MTNNGLGRGLNSLIPQKGDNNSLGGKSIPNIPLVTVNNNGEALEVSVDKITANPDQPRKTFTEHNLDELVESIKEHGVIQPLVVCKKDDHYELIAGERRLRASKKAGLEKVPVVVRTVSEQEKLEIGLIENIQREDLNPVELAKAYEQLMSEFNLNQTEVAKRLGKSRPVVANSLRLLNLPEEIKKALIEGKISEGHAKLLIGLDTEEKQRSLFNKILRSSLTVKDTNQEAKRMGGTKEARIKINYADKDKEFALREFFGSRAEIKRKGKGGQIIMDFYSDDELAEIINKVRG